MQAPTPKEQQILMAAVDLFGRYGFGKTTMADIAAQAGVARATVYNAFANKDDVLRGVLRMMALTLLDSVSKDWAKSDSLSDKLSAFFQQGPLTWYDMIQASPDMAEVLDGFDKTAHAELHDGATMWQDAIGEMLVDHATPGTDRAALADFIYSNALAAKHHAATRAVVEQRLDLLRQSVLALLKAR